MVQRQLGRIAPKDFVVGEVLQLHVPPQLGVHQGPHQGRQIQVHLQEGIQLRGRCRDRTSDLLGVNEAL